MSEAQAVAPEGRGKLMLKWRTTLGWSVGEVAKRVGVSTRTISSVESGSQIMPDARWRLLVHEVAAEVQRGDSLDCVVVLGERQTPIDVVSSDNYAGYTVSEDGRTALIASHSINRQGTPELHRQRFSVELNHHVIRAIERWETARQEEIPSNQRAAYDMQRWLMRMVLKGELNNPNLTKLKAAINDAKSELEHATDEPEDVRLKLMNKMDRAIAELMEEVAKSTK
ncbi:XRE family transcriptional regulator [Pseudomonas cavernicola]|uniref:XRE family transcriptional regulator n=1 Tax=Pseudomonas cavernicola TaxID=2320866 RepID=A0A418X888_9PSED|nr:helix-turn-helix transcriptional regulator [Pseudomonas cavernicola]RJG08651.1 XRE family transcriptional regulator [Pseudomonas cavernicola]